MTEQQAALDSSTVLQQTLVPVNTQPVQNLFDYIHLEENLYNNSIFVLWLFRTSVGLEHLPNSTAFVKQGFKYIHTSVRKDGTIIYRCNQYWNIRCPNRFIYNPKTDMVHIVCTEHIHPLEIKNGFLGLTPERVEYDYFSDYCL